MWILILWYRCRRWLAAYTDPQMPPEEHQQEPQVEEPGSESNPEEEASETEPGLAD